MSALAYTDINSEDRLVQATFAHHLENALGWDSVYAWNQETFGPTGTLGRASERDAVLVRDLRAALVKLNPLLPSATIDETVTKLKAASERQDANAKLTDIALASDDETRQVLHAQRDRLLAKADWLNETIVEIIISEAQNEVGDFKKWGFDIIPHRARMKLGFETPDGKRMDVETAFKNPKHPFRVAIVCAMWLTGFDVECLSTLYIDKPMRAHTLMQAIARANRTLSRQGLRSDRGLQRHAKKPDLSMINMEKLRDEFAKKVKNKATVIEDIRQIVEDTFAKLLDVVNGLDAEQRRSVEEGLSEDQLALFDFLQREDLTKVDRERIKQASRELLAGVLGVIAPLDRWTEKEQTQAEVQTFILARIYQELPEPTYTAEDKQHAAELVYRHIWQQRVSERFSTRQA